MKFWHGMLPHGCSLLIASPTPFPTTHRYPALMLAGTLTSGQLLIVWYVLNMMTAASWSACAAAPVPCLTDLASRTLSTNVASVLVSELSEGGLFLGPGRKGSC